METDADKQTAQCAEENHTLISVRRHLLLILSLSQVCITLRAGEKGG